MVEPCSAVTDKGVVVRMNRTIVGAGRGSAKDWVLLVLVVLAGAVITLVVASEDEAANEVGYWRCSGRKK